MVATSRPPTVSFNCCHCCADGQQLSPGRQRHEEELDLNATGLAWEDVRIQAKKAAPVTRAMLARVILESELHERAKTGRDGD